MIFPLTVPSRYFSSYSSTVSIFRFLKPRTSFEHNVHSYTSQPENLFDRNSDLLLIFNPKKVVLCIINCKAEVFCEMLKTLEFCVRLIFQQTGVQMCQKKKFLASNKTILAIQEGEEQNSYR